MSTADERERIIRAGRENAQQSGATVFFRPKTKANSCRRTKRGAAGITGSRAKEGRRRGRTPGASSASSLLSPASSRSYGCCGREEARWPRRTCLDWHSVPAARALAQIHRQLPRGVGCALGRYRTIGAGGTGCLTPRFRSPLLPRSLGKSTSRCDRSPPSPAQEIAANERPEAGALRRPRGVDRMRRYLLSLP
jgi:hypothetical protein